MLEDNEDAPELSAQTLAVLLEFYKEQAEHSTKNLITNCNDYNLFDEDWQLSQFWYDEITISTIIKIVRRCINTGGRIALISCPTLYKPLKNEIDRNYEIRLFEYDKRFVAFGSDFNFYDYHSPLCIPKDCANYYDLVIADPPFLSEECLTKVADTMKCLSNQKMILCTGIIMSDLAKKLLNMSQSSFVPSHKNNLANEFCCLSNFDIDLLL